MGPEETAPYDYAEILRRRKWSIMVPAFVILLASVIVARSLPSVYQSTATILIEEQEIPADFVATTVTSYVEQRLQSISQRIMSTSQLSKIIDDLNLYADLREKSTKEEIISKMRKDTKFESVSTESVDRRTGRPITATIAFKLSFEGKYPNKVQQVASLLASLYLEENLRVRKQQTMETSKFLEDEVEKVKVDLAEIEKKISAFKKMHMNELPELLKVNVQTLSSIERSIERLEDQGRSLKEREGYLQAQLVSIPPELEAENLDEKRLEELKVHLVQLRTRFSDEYPDVIKTVGEIAELEKKIADPYASGSESDLPTNPAYVTLSSQLASTQTDIVSVRQQIRRLEKKANQYRQRIENSPKLEEEYNALIIQRNTTHAKIDDLMRKVLEAKVAYGLEEEQKGERFTLIDPAVLPEKPFKPNRKAIALIGFVLGIGAGVGTGALKEFMDQSVRNANSLASATSFPVLAVIPEIMTKWDRRNTRIKRIILMILLLLVASAGVAAFHYLVMDLSILWAKLLRKFLK